MANTTTLKRKSRITPGLGGRLPSSSSLPAASLVPVRFFVAWTIGCMLRTHYR